MILSADGRTPIQSDAEKQQADQHAMDKMNKMVNDVVAVLQTFKMNDVLEPVSKYEGALIGLNLIMLFLKAHPTMEQTITAANHIGQMIDQHCSNSIRERQIELRIAGTLQAANQQGMPT